MKINILTDIILIMTGVAAVVFYGVNYTAREKVVDIDIIRVITEKTKALSLIVGGGAYWRNSIAGFWEKQS